MQTGLLLRVHNNLQPMTSACSLLQTGLWLPVQNNLLLLRLYSSGLLLEGLRRLWSEGFIFVVVVGRHGQLLPAWRLLSARLCELAHHNLPVDRVVAASP